MIHIRSSTPAAASVWVSVVGSSSQFCRFSPDRTPSETRMENPAVHGLAAAGPPMICNLISYTCPASQAYGTSSRIICTELSAAPLWHKQPSLATSSIVSPALICSPPMPPWYDEAMPGIVSKTNSKVPSARRLLIGLRSIDTPS